MGSHTKGSKRMARRIRGKEKMKSITKDEYREAKKHWDNYRGKYMEQLQNEMEIAKRRMHTELVP